MRKKVAELTKQIEAPPTFNLAWFLDDMGRAHFDRGECYFHLGEYANAINDFTAASRSRMNNCLEGTGHTSFDGCEGLADVHCAIGQFDKAAEDLEQIIRIEENYEFGEKHEKGPAYAPLYLYRAQCLIETQQYEAALTELNKCETALPYPADPYAAIPKNEATSIHALRAVIFRKLGKLDSAWNEWRFAITRPDRDPLEMAAYPKTKVNELEQALRAPTKDWRLQLLLNKEYEETLWMLVRESCAYTLNPPRAGESTEYRQLYDRVFHSNRTYYKDLIRANQKCVDLTPPADSHELAAEKRQLEQRREQLQNEQHLSWLR